MQTTLNLKPTLEFCKELKTNNNKAWFDEHRSAYEAAKGNFEAFVDGFITEFRSVDDLGDISARDCTFRINRDIRFSRDKSPYKTNFAAHVARGGRKSRVLGYYIQLAPGGESFLAGGLHDPTPEELATFRKNVARNSDPLRRILKNSKFTQYYGSVSGEQVKTAPQGYSKDHPAIEFLKMKQLLAMHALTDRDVLAPDFLSYTIQAFRALKPLLDYLNTAIR